MAYRGQGKLLFLYVAENAPHWPWQALPEGIDQYKDTCRVRRDSIRNGRYRRLVHRSPEDCAPYGPGFDRPTR